MDFGIAYLLTKITHAARMVVSIYSLRRYYSGEITIVTTTNEAAEIAGRCVNDPALRVSHRRLDLRYDLTTRNGSYLTKVALISQPVYPATVFLDADTLVVGSIEPLVSASISNQIVVTSYCDWMTTDKPVKKNLATWRQIEQKKNDIDLKHLIELTTTVSLPAINLGVIGIQKNATIIDEWRSLAELGQDMFLPDEASFQFLLPRHQHFLLGSEFNCSPSYCTTNEARIYHFIAGTHLHKQADQDAWLPMYRECRSRGIAGIQDWSRLRKMDQPINCSSRNTGD